MIRSAGSRISGGFSKHGMLEAKHEGIFEMGRHFFLRTYADLD